jgi:hypothetical protein
MKKSKKIDALHLRMSNILGKLRLPVREWDFNYNYESNKFVLLVQSASPEKTEEAGAMAWDSFPDDLKRELDEEGIGFECK